MNKTEIRYIEDRAIEHLEGQYMLVTDGIITESEYLENIKYDETIDVITQEEPQLFNNINPFTLRHIVMPLVIDYFEEDVS